MTPQLSQDDYQPPAVPSEEGFYWAYPIWQFGDEYRMVVLVSHGSGEEVLLVAADLTPEPWLHARQVIPHDILRWGPKVEFPSLGKQTDPSPPAGPDTDGGE